MKKELIEISEVNGIKFVNSVRELYLDLGLDRTNWSRWSKKNIIDDKFFKENVDYEIVKTKVYSNTLTDYMVTLDMAETIKNKYKIKREKNKPNKIYIFKANKYYKIGKCNNVKRRVKQLQTGCMFDIEILDYFEVTDATKTEKELHEKYKHKQIKGEWFKLTKKDVMDIRKIIDIA